jgi:hypothetical protein
MAANGALAVGSLCTINVADIAYASNYTNGIAPCLDGLAGLQSGSVDCSYAQVIDMVLAEGTKSGYRFTYAPVFRVLPTQPAISPKAAARGCTSPGAVGYTVNADPVVRGNTGRRSL